MKCLNSLLVAVLAAIVLLPFFHARPVFSETLTAKKMVEHVETLLRGKNNHAVYTMQVRTPEWERELRLEAWDDRSNQRALIKILAPSKDRDTRYLKIEYKLWMYLPKLERILKIPPSMMMQSWMGSDFNNDDLVKESSIVQDYEHKIAGEKTLANIVACQIELTPKPHAPVVWGKILYWISKDGLLPLREQFFDERGKLIKELLFSEFKVMDGRKIPTLYTMTSKTKPGHKTLLIIEKIKYNQDIDERLFSMRNLKRTR